MKNLWSTLATVMVGLALASMPARAQNFTCTGPLAPNLVYTFASVTVPANRNCVMAGVDVTVTGNVSVGPGALLGVNAALNIQGNMTLEKGAVLDIAVAILTVDGNITSTNAAQLLLEPANTNGNNVCPECGGTIGGNITVVGTSDYVIFSVIVGGQVTVIGNDTGTNADNLIEGNTISGNLVCQNNTPPPTGGSNSVSGKKIGQCTGL